MMKLLVLLLVLSAAPASGELYTWKDTSGTSHYTNLPDTIPQKYRKKVKVLVMPGEQKKEQPQGQPGQSSPSQSAPAVNLPMPPPAPAAVSRPPPAAVSEPPPATLEREGRKERRPRRRPVSDE